MRAGIIAKKIGMSNLFTPGGINIPVTVLMVDECKVIERHEVNNSDIRSLLMSYSPNNKLLESSNPVSWGQGFQHLIIDIIMGNDITSPTYKSRTKH